MAKKLTSKRVEHAQKRALVAELDIKIKNKRADEIKYSADPVKKAKAPGNGEALDLGACDDNLTRAPLRSTLLRCRFSCCPSSS
jgi:hypothetical protein